MSKAQILAVVIAWLHNDLASGQSETFWTMAKAAILGDVYGLDTTAADWDETHAATYPALWTFACLNAGRLFIEDYEGAAAAGDSYRGEVSRVGTSVNIRPVTGQLRRPYGA